MVSPKVDQSHKGNEVNFDLPPKFDEYVDEQQEIKEEEKEDREEKDGTTFEEILVEADEYDMLTLDTHDPPRSNEHLSLLLTFDESSLNAPNFELRLLNEVVQNKSEASSMYTIQTSMGNNRKKVSKSKRDLFTWLILFQPELSQVWKMITQMI